MNTLYRSRLYTEFRTLKTPAIRKESDDGTHAMFLTNTQKCIQSLFKPCRIRFPHHIMQEYAYRIESEFPGTSQLQLHGFRIKSLLLPHLKLIDCRSSNVVDTHRPFLRCVPCVCFFRRPSFSLLGAAGCCQ